MSSDLEPPETRRAFLTPMGDQGPPHAGETPRTTPLPSTGPGRADAPADQKPFRVLSVDGGGFLGLASAAFIAGIEAHTGRPLAGSFDLFCGTSTGAIISLALAYGKSGEELVDLYETLGDRVFRRKGRGWLSAKYPSDPLRAVLTEQFGATTLGDLHANRKATLVTALNLTTGTPRVFKTDHSANLSRDNGLRLVDIAMASTAAPTFFPVVRLENPGDRLREEFCDAGVVCKPPRVARVR
jgi:patatin-like phospholipase/acyl hydrolase